MYDKINTLYQKLDELEASMSSNPTDEQLQQWNSLKTLIAKEYQVVDGIRLERHNWEVRNSYKVATIIRGFINSGVFVTNC